MSVSAEVRRTLVKSPPELWAELSDPTALARHLGELGEIRIVRTEPDRAVDWEAAAADGAHASGRVAIEPSGWGTRVTLTANRAIVAPALAPEVKAEAEIKPEAEAEIKPEAEAEAIEVAVEREPESEPVEVAVEPEREIKAGPEPVPVPEITKSAPRRGFFARLFRRRGPAEPEPAVEPEAEQVAEPEPAVEPGAEQVTEPEPDTEQAAEPEPEPIAEVEIAEPAPQAAAPEPDISAELAALEEQTTAMLTGVLDRLGAAHHRPFSRA
jgi:hypothetical protein